LAGNLLKKYLKIRINILGSGKLERAFRAFICATGDLCLPLRAELVYGLWQAVLNLPLVGGRFYCTFIKPGCYNTRLFACSDILNAVTTGEPRPRSPPPQARRRRWLSRTCVVRHHLSRSTRRSWRMAEGGVGRGRAERHRQRPGPGETAEMGRRRPQRGSRTESADV
jgi:hypothetical protein